MDNLSRILIALVLPYSVVSKIVYHTREDDRTKATPYVPRIIDKTCLLKPDKGPCRANIKMYFFDPATLKCYTFAWGGCQGNGNRFDTIEDCMGSCLSKPNQIKGRPKYCFLTFDYGYCFGATNRWYFDRQWKVCKQTLYSGCGGNKNNFYSLAQCESVCRFGKGIILPVTKNDSQITVSNTNPVEATTKNKDPNIKPK